MACEFRHREAVGWTVRYRICDVRDLRKRFQGRPVVRRLYCHEQDLEDERAQHECAVGAAWLLSVCLEDVPEQLAHGSVYREVVGLDR